MTQDSLLGPDDYPSAVRVGLTTFGSYLAVSVVIAAVLAGVASESTDVLAFAKLGVMLAALGLRGQLFTDYGTRDGFGGSSSVGFGFVPLLLLGLAVSLSLELSAREPAARSSRQAGVRALLTGVVAVVPLAVLALASHLSGNAFGGGDSGETVGAKVGPLLIYGITLISAFSYVGRLKTYRAATGQPPVVRALAAKTEGIAPWFTSAFQAAVVSGGLIIVTGIGYGILSSRHEVGDASGSADGSNAAVVLAAVLLLPNILFAVTGFFMGFTVDLGIFGYFGGNVGLLEGNVSSLTYLWVLAPLVAAALIGVRQQLRASTTFAASWWRAGVGSAAFWLLMSQLLELQASSATIGFSAGTLVLLGFGWGVAMLALGKYLVGPLVHARPKLAWRLAGPGIDPAWAVHLAPRLGLEVPVVEGYAAPVTPPPAPAPMKRTGLPPVWLTLGVDGS